MSLSAEVARTQLANWPKAEVECGATKPVVNSAGPMAQGGSGGVWGRKSAVQGPPIDPSNGPIAGLVERDTFFSDPPFGLWGLFENPIGQNLGQ